MSLLLAAWAAAAGFEGWRLPAFEFTAATASSQRSFSSSELEGRTWVANFIFTRCAGPCPALTFNMAGLQKRLPDAVRLVSFSVDPERDTPRDLRDYARRFRAEPRRWVFLTGKAAAVHGVLREGFKLPAVADPKAPSGKRVAHSTKFVLVGPGLAVRGLYDGNDPKDLDRLVQDARLLER